MKLLFFSNFFVSIPIWLWQSKATILKESSAGNVKATKQAFKAATKEVYEKMNTPFEKKFGVAFAVAQASVPELNVQVKKILCWVETRKEKSGVHKKHIHDLWAQWIVTPCLELGRPTATSNKRDFYFPLKPKKMLKIGPTKERIWKNKASTGRKGTPN